MHRRPARQDYLEVGIMGIIMSLIGAVLLLAMVSFFRRGSGQH